MKESERIFRSGLQDRPVSCTFKDMSNATTTTATNTFKCDTCFDTGHIDHAGAEIKCTDCEPTIKVKLSGGPLGAAEAMFHCTSTTKTTATFHGHLGAILAEARHAEHAARQEARRQGRTGRNSCSSSEIALRATLIRNAR